MHRTLPAPILAALIVATTLVGVLAVAVHHDSSPTKITAGSAPKSGGSTPSADTSPSDTYSTTTTPAPGSDTTGPSPTTTTPTAAPTTAAGRPGVTTATTRPTTATTHPATTAPPPTAAGPAPTRPGKYTYTQTGTNSLAAVTPQGMLTISQSGGTETWTRSDGSISVLVFNGSGVFTQSLTEAGAGTCAFAPPVAWPPWPLTVGRPFTGQATCSGGATVALDGQVGNPASLPLDGSMISTFAVNTRITLSASGVAITVTQTDWYAPSLRLAVKTQVVSNQNPYGVSINETSTLVSANPTP